MWRDKVFINDVCCAIPFDDFNMQKAIISDLDAQKRRGLDIRGIEVDRKSRCVIYRIPNTIFR